MQYLVLNLVINGIPSIPHEVWFILDHYFNVLNLVINGIPSIRLFYRKGSNKYWVLNLVINGIPSILNASPPLSLLATLF